MSEWVSCMRLYIGFFLQNVVLLEPASSSIIHEAGSDLLFPRSDWPRGCCLVLPLPREEEEEDAGGYGLGGHLGRSGMSSAGQPSACLSESIMGCPFDLIISALLWATSMGGGGGGCGVA